jgi:hypothetical protein
MRFVVALAALLSLAVPAVQPQPPAGWPAVRRFFLDGVTQHGIVGASLAWIEDGRIAACETAGLSALDAALRDTIVKQLWGRR